MDKLFGTDGVRGKAGKKLDAFTAMRFSYGCWDIF